VITAITEELCRAKCLFTKITYYFLILCDVELYYRLTLFKMRVNRIERGLNVGRAYKLTHYSYLSESCYIATELEGDCVLAVFSCNYRRERSTSFYHLCLL